MKSITVNPGETVTMGSETGEWLLNTYFIDNLSRNKLTTFGYSTGQVIGRFRYKPYANNMYAWMCNKDFEILYHSGTASFKMSRR